MGGKGAVGSFSSCGNDEKLRQIPMISFMPSFLPANLRLTQAICPAETATRLQSAEIFMLESDTILPPATLPRILAGSTSDLSSSPARVGITLSIRSIEAGPGYPAPDTA